MKIKHLLALLLIISVAGCKKSTPAITHAAILSFDFEGQHHSFNLGQLQLQVIDTGATEGKYLSFNTGSGSFPQVQFSLTDRSSGYSANCFSPGHYPCYASNPLCQDSIASRFCVGFFMQYTDTLVGRVGMYAVNDSLSSLTLTSCTGGGNGIPDTINATFNCTLADSTGNTSPKQVTNGQLSYITYTR